VAHAVDPAVGKAHDAQIASDQAVVAADVAWQARVLGSIDVARANAVADFEPGWYLHFIASRLQIAYLTVGDAEARELMKDVPE
jgi:hypothetical protein